MNNIVAASAGCFEPGPRMKEIAEFIWSRRTWLLGTLQGRGVNSADAEDLLQDAILELVEDVRFDPQRPDAPGYARGRLRYLWLHLRRRKGREVPREPSDSPNGGEPLALAPCPESLLPGEHAALLETVAGLSASDQDLLRQVVVEGRKPTEIARAIKVTPVALRKRLQRALKRARTGWENATESWRTSCEGHCVR